MNADYNPFEQARRPLEGSLLNRAAQRTAQVAGYAMNPMALATVGAGAAVAGGGYLMNRERQRRNAPGQIGSQIGSSANFDAMTELSDRQRDMMSGWDEEQTKQFQTAIEDSVTNQVRLGTMSPEEAQARVAQASFTLKPSEINNSGQLQQGAMQATDLPNATSHLGDYNGTGLDEEYWSQLRNAAALQENITQDVGDMQLSREFDRTAKYRLPMENYRMNRDFAYGQKGEQNAMKRGMAQNLLGSYTNTAQALMTSGL